MRCQPSEQIKTAAPDLIAVESSHPCLHRRWRTGRPDAFIQADLLKPYEILKAWKSVYRDAAPSTKISALCHLHQRGFISKTACPARRRLTYDDYLILAKQLTLDSQGRNAADPQFDPSQIVQYGTTIPYWGGTSTQGWFRGFQNILYSFDAHALSPDGTQVSGSLNSPAALNAWEFARTWHKHVAPDVRAHAQPDGNASLSATLAIVGLLGPGSELDAIPVEWAVVPGRAQRAQMRH
jgi:hypothetical protein